MRSKGEEKKELSCSRKKIVSAAEPLHGESKKGVLEHRGRKEGGADGVATKSD